MSTEINTNSSPTHFDDHYFQYLHPFDHHQQREITTSNSQDILSNHLNDNEHCQICGDLASGWHCGYI